MGRDKTSDKIYLLYKIRFFVFLIIDFYIILVNKSKQ